MVQGSVGWDTICVCKLGKLGAESSYYFSHQIVSSSGMFIMACRLICWALLFLCVSAQPCSSSIPGSWSEGNPLNNTYTLEWTQRPSFRGIWPPGLAKKWDTVNGTFSADYTSVVADFSNGHHGVGTLHAACDTIHWDDGTTWVSSAPLPLIQVHIVPHTHDDVGWDETYMQVRGGGFACVFHRHTTQRAKATSQLLINCSPDLPPPLTVLQRERAPNWSQRD